MPADKDVKSWVTALVDQEYVKGNVPPNIVRSAVPSVPPLQLVGLADTFVIKGFGWLIVTLFDDKHPLTSTTFTPCTPANNPIAMEEVWPLFQV